MKYENVPFSCNYLNIKRRKDLSPADKLVFSEIANLDNEEHCKASNPYIADLCGLSVATVSRSIKVLTEKKLIECWYSPNNHRIIKCVDILPSYTTQNDMTTQNDTTTHIKMSRGSTQNDKSIYNNNIKENNIEENNSIDNNNGLDIYSHNNIKELRSDKPGLKDYEKPLMHSMEDAINGLTESGNFIRGIEINDSFIDKMMYVAKSYADRYYKEYDKPHPYINANDEFSPMQEVVLRFIDGDRSIADLSEKDIDTTIDLFFKNKKFMDSNHRISLFSMPDIWIRRVKEMERLEDKPNFYGIGLWQLPESEPDGWWTKDKMPDEWNDCSKIAQ